MTIRRILNLLRGFFLLGALACVGTKCAWEAYYPSIRKLDWGLVKLYTRHADDALERAQGEIRAGQSGAAIVTLTELCNSLQDLRFGARLAPVRSKALDLLADQHRKAGDLEEALRWTDELHAFDDRDFINLLRRAELLEALGFVDEALLQTRENYRIGSTSGAAQLAHLHALARRGLTEEAAGVLLETRGRGIMALQLEGWEIRWSATTKIGGVDRRNLTLSFDPETGVHRSVELFDGDGVAIETLRFDFPSASTPCVTALRVTFRTSGGAEHVFTLDDQYAIKQLERDGDTLLAHGDIDPYVTLRRPVDPSAIEGVVECRLEFVLTAVVPDDIKALFSDGLPADALEGWIARYGLTAVENLKVALEQ